MIRVDCVQGSPEWHAARLGIPTASQFSRILTPSGKLSASADGYMHELLAERLLGCPLESESLGFMERGTALEAEAVAWFELQTDKDTEAVGLCLTEDRKAGCSPDRLVGADGGLEIKCPSPAVHVGYCLMGGATAKYWPQIQGALWITGRQWWDVLSYHPLMPPALVRAERDEEYIGLLKVAVAGFLERLEASYGRLRPSVAAGSVNGMPRREAEPETPAAIQEARF